MFGIKQIAKYSEYVINDLINSFIINIHFVFCCEIFLFSDKYSKIKFDRVNKWNKNLYNVINDVK